MAEKKKQRPIARLGRTLYLDNVITKEEIARRVKRSSLTADEYEFITDEVYNAEDWG